MTRWAKKRSFDLPETQRSGLGVEDANRADRLTLKNERHTSVEADVRISGHSGVVRKSFLPGGVFHDRDALRVLDGMRAKRKRAQPLSDFGAGARFEKFVRTANDADHGDRCLADLGGDCDDRVVGRAFEIARAKTLNCGQANSFEHFVKRSACRDFAAVRELIPVPRNASGNRKTALR